MSAVALAQQSPMPKPRIVPLADIGFDTDYQRDLESSRVHKMVREWDGRRCASLMLSARGGRLWCVDGQHRIAAMRELGIDAWMAIVLEGMTKQEEADLYILLQLDRKSLNAWDLFKAGKTAAHADVIAIIRIIQKHGFRLAPTAGPNHIGAIGAIRRIFRLGGERLLNLTLDTTARHWATAVSDRHSVARQGISLEGLAIFLHSFREQPQYDPDRARVVLEKNSPAIFIRKAQELAMERMRANSSPVMVAEALRDVYNAGLKRDRKLGGIRQTKASPKKYDPKDIKVAAAKTR
ncbi:MAG TPA: DUF6551 family protein [Candidatus Limnocylindria bacterium]|jgi:hypothetical protein|nr:DUF6551 family protein [Candidatus Limnocylindria bacterium]